MMILYSLILVASVILLGAMLSQVLHGVATHARLNPHYAQLGVLISIIGFLMVVSVPAGVLVAAIVLAIATMARPQLAARQGPSWWALLLVAALLAVLGVWELTMTSLVASALLLVVAFCLFAAVLVLVRPVHLAVEDFSLAVAAAVMPLLVAPVAFSAAHPSIALDGALLMGGLLAAQWQAARQPVAPFLRLPVALLLAYGMTQAVRYGAWPCAAASLAGFGGALWWQTRRAHA